MGALIAAGIGLVGSMMASDAAGNAADAQMQSANQATKLQKEMFDISRADQMPWLTRGNQAGDLLSMYLGLPGSQGASAGGVAQGMGARPTPEQFMTRPATNRPELNYLGTDYSGAHYAGVPQGMNLNYLSGVQQPTIDQAAYQQALSQWNQKNDAMLAAQDAARQADPRYGSLLREFTGANLQNDPGYQFGLNQGEQSIVNQAAATGGLQSGATLKALTKFGTDYGGTKFNEAFNRNQANKTFINNALAGQSGTGQMAATNMANQSAQVGNAIGQNIIGAGNARASGYVGSANAITSGIGNAYNNYTSQQLLKQLGYGNEGGVGNSTGVVYHSGPTPSNELFV